MNRKWHLWWAWIFNALTNKYWGLYLTCKGAHATFCIRAHEALSKEERTAPEEQEKFKKFLMGKGPYP